MRTRDLFTDSCRFLWVAFQIQDLCEQQSDEEIVNALNDLPKSLPEVFNRIIHRLRNSNPKRAQRIFKWIATARRPLTLEELREAICIEPGQTDLKVERLVNNMYHALACCGSLVTVDEEQCTIHFAHHSIKQHLISKATEDVLAQYHLSMPEAEIEAGEICVTYLNFSMFDRRIRNIPGAGMDCIAYPAEVVKQTLPQGNLASKLALSYLKDRKFSSTSVHRQLKNTAEVSNSQQSHPYHTFLGYAREFWLIHTKRITNASPEALRLWSRLIVNDNDINDRPWTTLDWETLGTKVLQFVVDNDHEVLLRHILARDEFQITPGHRGYPESPVEPSWESLSAMKFLHMARILFEENRQNLLQILLETPKLQILRNGLFIPIIMSGDMKLFILNLAQGGSWRFEIPGRWAEAYDLATVRFAYRHDGSTVRFIFTPLMLAVDLGQTNLVRYMLSVYPNSTSSDMKSVDWNLNPHFIRAVMRNHKYITMILLQSRRVEPNQSTEDGWTPLFYAVHKGYRDVAAYLIQMGANTLHRALDGSSVDDVARAAGHAWHADPGPYSLDADLPAAGDEDDTSDTASLDTAYGVLRRTVRLASFHRRGSLQLPQLGQ